MTPQKEWDLMEDPNLTYDEPVARTEFNIKPYPGFKITYQAKTGLVHISMGETIISTFVPKDEQWDMECWIEACEEFNK